MNDQETPDWLEWVVAAQRGSRPAFERLYQRFVKLAHGILLARFPRAIAEELTQECFLIAYRKLHQLREPAKFAPWLIAIAKRLDSPADRRHDEELTGEILDPSVSTEIDTDALHALRAIRQLPDTYRETLILRLVEGMSGAEIAEATGMTPESVRVNLHRGMSKLREALAIRVTRGTKND